MIKHHCPRCKCYFADNKFCRNCNYQYYGIGKSYHNNHLRQILQDKGIRNRRLKNKIKVKLSD